MVDTVEQFALGYPGQKLSDLVTRYVVVSRLVMISDRTDDEKVRLLQDLASPVQGIFFARWWWRIGHLADERERLHALLDQLTSSDRPTGSNTQTTIG
jgi:hypothetical protein